MKGFFHKQFEFANCSPENHILLLTDLPMKKMAANLADDIFNWMFLNRKGRIPIQISLKFVSGSPIDKKPALIQTMAWRRTGDKPLPKPMITQFIDSYTRH